MPTLLAPADKQLVFDELLVRIDEMVHSSMPAEEALTFIVRMLRNDVPYYNWVGYYLVHPTEARQLVVGPYDGEETEHTRIKFGQGICGQAADTGETFIVQDVNQESNYLSCSIATKSEIVVPAFDGATMVGQIDIDSHVLEPFTPEDEAFLKAVCTRTAPLLSQLQQQLV